LAVGTAELHRHSYGLVVPARATSSAPPPLSCSTLAARWADLRCLRARTTAPRCSLLAAVPKLRHPPHPELRQPRCRAPAPSSPPLELRHLVAALELKVLHQIENGSSSTDLGGKGVAASGATAARARGWWRDRQSVLASRRASADGGGRGVPETGREKDGGGGRCMRKKEDARKKKGRGNKIKG